MLRLLEQFLIYSHFISPGNFQWNGKIESFWKKKNDKHCKIIDKYIEKYNHIRALTGLEKTKNGNLKRPKDVFCDETLMWQRNFNWEYLVDGAITGFRYNKEKEN